MAWNENFTIATILLSSLLIGLVIQRWLLPSLCRLVSKTKWHWDKIILQAMGRMPLLWCSCLGIYAASLQPSLAPHQKILYKVLVILSLGSITVVLARIATQLVSASSRRAAHVVASTSLLVNVVRITIYVIGGIILLQNLNIEITPIITTLGIGGLAVALALEETLKNLFSGIQIIASEIVRTGDYIRLESGLEGFVTDIKARSTTINSFPENNRIIVPNSVLASSTVINYNLPTRHMWATVEVGVAYSSDLPKVERVALEVGRAVIEQLTGTAPSHDPILRFHAFDSSSINFTIRLYADGFENQFGIRHEYIKALHARFREESIEIPFPIRTVYHRGLPDNTSLGQA